jgi:mRNA-degrading endonuclease RelE of RelBE toxin-antitoxin system
MYNLHYSQNLFNKIKDLGVDYPSLVNKVKALTENPHEIAIATNVEAFCDYYVNAGKHAILFDIDQDEEKILLKHILLKARLHKILTGRIEAPNN